MEHSIVSWNNADALLDAPSSNTPRILAWNDNFKVVQLGIRTSCMAF